MNTGTASSRSSCDCPKRRASTSRSWGGHPTFRVRGKNFVFSYQTAEHLSLKLPLPEAEAFVATDDDASPAGYWLS